MKRVQVVFNCCRHKSNISNLFKIKRLRSKKVSSQKVRAVSEKSPSIPLYKRGKQSECPDLLRYYLKNSETASYFLNDFPFLMPAKPMRPQPNNSIITGPARGSVRVIVAIVLAYVRVTNSNKNNKINNNFFTWYFLLKLFPSNYYEANKTTAK